MADAQRVESYLSSRERILEAARQLFAAKGFGETSVDEIADLAGVAKGTIYTHFASKDELLVTIIRIGTNELLGQIDKIMKKDIPFTQQLKGVIKVTLEYFDRHHNFHRVYSAQRERLPTPVYQTQKVHDELFQQFWNFHAKFTVYMQDGIDSGHFRVKSAEEIAFYLPHYIGATMFFNGLRPKKQTIAELTESVYDHFMYGFGSNLEEE